MAGSIDGRSGSGEKKKKRKRQVTVSVEGVSGSADRIAPVIGYFPSGYDATRSPGGEPIIRTFGNKAHPSRIELVVSPPGSSVDFVGRSYAGETARQQLCSYAIGVFDKDAQTLKIVPIAGNKIMRLEPKFPKKLSADTEQSAGITEQSNVVAKVERNIEDLTSLYGAKRDKDRDKKWRTLNQQKDESNDPLALEQVESHDVDEGTAHRVIRDTAETVTRNIPPYDPSADTPEKAYRLDEIITKAERVHLTDFLENLESVVDFNSEHYPNFVINRINKLKETQNEEQKEKLACILSYITHLHNFWEKMSNSRHTKLIISDHKDQHRIPRFIYQNLLRKFIDSETNTLTSEKNELLIEYILVLTLFVDEFRTDPSVIAKDLKMSVNSLKPYYQQLGCKAIRESRLQPLFFTLPVPLKFSELLKRRR